MNDFVSIIIRTKNEEKWISSCLAAVFKQTYKNFEVIIVDNNSTDKTVEKTKVFNVKIVQIDDFFPGKALNIGIRNSKGNVIVSLSGHCIPVDDQWLANLLRNLDEKQVAGVYGRQEPLSFTSDVDKRDLINTFRLERIIQTKDSFFHNANSMLRRSVWDQIPFDEEVTNIEDRLWGKAVIEKGWKIVYEPKASVYHYHGIHQNSNQIRCSNVVKILEDLDIVKNNVINAKELKIIALVPIKKDLKQEHTRLLVNYTLRDLKRSKYIDKIYVVSDDKEIAEEAKKEGALIPFLRPKELSSNYVDISDVCKYALDRLEKENILADLVVSASITYPFRPAGIFDTLINEIIISGMDTVVAVRPEFRISWKINEKELNQLNDFRPRVFKDPIQIGMFGLGCVTHPFKIRENEIISGKVGIYEVNNQLCSFEVRTDADYEIFSKFIEDSPE